MSLVSIIVPVYNTKDYLPRCLESITTQTYTNLQIILVDDGSTDGSGMICDSYAANERRAVVLHQSNIGLYAARNAGQRKAEGEFILFVDSDDYIHPDMVRSMVDAIQRDESLDLCICDWRMVRPMEEEDALGENRASDGHQSVVLSQEDLIALWSEKKVGPYVWNKLYRKVALNGTEANPYRFAQDEEFNLRFYLNVRNAIWVRQEYYYFVQRPDSATHSPGYPLACAECSVRFYYDLLGIYEDRAPRYSHYLRRKLYTRMAFLRLRADGSLRETQIRQLCKEYESATIKDFLRQPGTSFFFKILILKLLHSQVVMKLFVRLTHN